MKMAILVKLLLIIALQFLLQSCEISSSNGQSIQEERDLYEQKQYANYVKLISSSITNPRDEVTMQQNSYHLSESSRLLVRLKSMGSKAQDAIISGDNKMYLAISADDFGIDKTRYAQSIEVCPITKNWMILATWSYAHTLPTSGGRWNAPGSDYSQNDCVKADLDYAYAENDALYFDISNWYLFYVKSKNKNYGLVIKSSTPIEIYGDEDSLRNPRFMWKQK